MTKSYSMRVIIVGLTVFLGGCLMVPLSSTVPASFQPDSKPINAKSTAWIDELIVARDLLQPPRLYRLDGNYPANSKLYVRKLQALMRSDSLPAEWYSERERCLKKVAASCAVGAYFADVIDESIRIYADYLASIPGSADRLSSVLRGDSRARSELPSTAASMIGSLSASTVARDRQSALRYLRLLARVRYGSEDNVRRVHAPEIVREWMQIDLGVRDFSDQKILREYQGLETIEISFLQQNICAAFAGASRQACDALFSRSPLNSLDYLIVTTPANSVGAPSRGGASRQKQPNNQLDELDQWRELQEQYLAGRERDIDDWWRSLFPLQYNSDLGETRLISGWGDKSSLALRRSKRPLPEAIKEAIRRKSTQLVQKSEFLGREYLSNLTIEFVPSPTYVVNGSEASSERNDAQFVFEHRVRKPVGAGSYLDVAQRLEELASLDGKRSFSDINASNVAGILAPGLESIGARAYRLEALWKDGRPTINISESIILHEYSACLLEPAIKVTVPDNRAIDASFATIMVYLHAVTVDLAAAAGFLSKEKMDPQLEKLADSSPLQVPLLHKEFDVSGSDAGRRARLVEVVLRLLLEDEVLNAVGDARPSDCIARRLAFSLAHEIAHLAMGQSGAIDSDEKLADCIGVILTSRNAEQGSASVQSVVGYAPSLYWSMNGQADDLVSEVAKREKAVVGYTQLIPTAIANRSLEWREESVRRFCRVPAD